MVLDGAVGFVYGYSRVMKLMKTNCFVSMVVDDVVVVVVGEEGMEKMLIVGYMVVDSMVIQKIGIVVGVVSLRSMLV